MKNAYQQMYEKKRRSCEECMSLIHSGDVLFCGSNYNDPVGLLSRLHEIADRLEDVYLYKSRVGDPEYMRTPGMSRHIRTVTYFYSALFRNSDPLGNCEYIPSDLPTFFENAARHKRPTMYIAAVTPMDENGDFSVGMNANFDSDAVQFALQEHCTILLEVNRNLLAMKGAAKINIRNVTCFYESDAKPLTSAQIMATEVEEQIGSHVAALIHDGDCLQLGFGGLPDCVARKLMDKNDLGLHTEQFTTTMGQMIRTGVITGRNKTIEKGLHIGAFAEGTQELYETLASNSCCVLMPGSYVVDPFVIAQIDNMVSINSCVEIDLTGQVCSESIGTQQYSGSGGQFCFAYGAYRSKGGRGIIALPSRTKRGVPKIRPLLTPGAKVTTLRNYVDWVVTEYGAVQLRGRTLSERAQALISIAHPEDRPLLTDQAKQQGLLHSL